MPFVFCMMMEYKGQYSKVQRSEADQYLFLKVHSSLQHSDNVVSAPQFLVCKTGLTAHPSLTEGHQLHPLNDCVCCYTT